MKLSGMYILPIGMVLGMPGVTTVSAQERCKMSLEISTSNDTLTQQHVMDVGDVAGHQITMVELHRVYPKDVKTNCEGLKRVEGWSHYFRDLIDGNGRAWGYGTTVFENGDKIFNQWAATRQTIRAGGNATDIDLRYVGGTGKYLGVRGFEHQRYNSVTAPNVGQIDIEYWFDK